MSKPTLRQATLADAKGYNTCLSRVALERQFIGFVEPPPIEQSEKWIASVIGSGCPFLIAEDSGRIVGWCDVRRREREGFTHLGELGMGVDCEFRGQGIGTELLVTALEYSRKIRLEKLELEVFASNTGARRLYEKFGFTVDGVRAKARKIDGSYTDVVCLSLFLTDNPD